MSRREQDPWPGDDMTNRQFAWYLLGSALIASAVFLLIVLGGTSFFGWPS